MKPWPTFMEEMTSMEEMTNSDVLFLVRKAFARRADLSATTLTGRVRLPSEQRVGYETRQVVEDITPAKAMQLIAGCWERYSNGRNFYPTRLEKINQFAHMMRDGLWEYDAKSDPICVTDGLVTGGRHRLHAVLLSHVTIRSNVQYRNTKEPSNGITNHVS